MTALPPFANEPVLELRRAPARAALEEGLRRADAALPLRVPVLVAGDAGAAEGLVSIDPARPDRVVATAGVAGPADVDAAVAAARSDAGRAWARRPARERAAVLVAAADRLRRRRDELAGLILREAGKPWAEADADVCEAVDFLEFYAREGIALEEDPPPLLQPPGERNELRARPRGVAAVIAPWNFPLAIPCGMVAAALAAGNAVVLKPAEQAPGCSGELVRELHAAGVPPAALSLVPGEGDVGAALVRHPGVHVVAFTGSEAVGLEILREAAATPEGQLHVKHVVAEMGGKNCILVDADADLDDAVPGIVRSAFGYAGQKCSAASRVLCHEAIADALVERLAGAVGVLEPGPPDAWGADVPPVIEASARDRLADLVDGLAGRARLAARGAAPPDGEGFYVSPALLTDVPPDAPVLRDEVFGPLLTVEPVPSMAAACDVVDGLASALTGGLYARDPRVVAEIARRTPVGNLYVNRPITGAMVGRQPFGGNRRSGTGTKAGGPGYVRAFTEPYVVTENTVRHGLVV